MLRRLVSVLVAVAALAGGFAVVDAGPAAAQAGVGGSVSGRVWLDRNADASPDATEGGIPAVDVKLSLPGLDGAFGTADDVVVATRTTDATGAYAFNTLVPATYAVSVVAATAPAGTAATTSDPRSVTIGLNQALTGVDFGRRWTASVGDHVFVDGDADGQPDPGEPGLSGIALSLRVPGSDNLLGTPDDETVGTATTASNGSFGFQNLPAGSYRLVADQLSAPPAMVATRPNPMDFTLAAGQAKADADVGFAHTGGLGGAVWLDSDADGEREAGEAVLAGVGVSVVGLGADATLGTADDIALPPRSTGPDGRWAAAHLAGGQWQLSVDTASAPAGTATSGRASPSLVTIAAGGIDEGIDFGFRYTAAIGDAVFVDRDGDGHKDEQEPGLAGVRVRLHPAGPDGVVDTADDGAEQDQLTTAAGGYDFARLAPGRYRVSVDTSTAPAGSAPTTATVVETTLAANEQQAGVDFGFRDTAAIGDRVWLDGDGDGTEDPGEAGLAGVTVLLGDQAGLALATVVSAGDGSYSFDHLAAGTYRISVDGATTPAGTVASTTVPLEVTLAAGQQVSSADVGLRYDGAIGDRVWLDGDGDGIEDYGEAGLAGVAVALVGAGPDGELGGADDVALGTATTTAGGSYTFANLAPGPYRVSAGVFPAGMAPTTPSAVEVELDAHQQESSVDFGMAHTGAVAGQVWIDADGDGLRDAGDDGRSGVAVVLRGAGADGQLDTGDDTTLTQATDAGGSYLFVRLAPGRYRVGPPAGELPAGSAHSTEPAVEVDLEAGQVAGQVGFGLRWTGAISGHAWSDDDSDGVRDPGEGGAAGAVVHVATAGPDGVVGNEDDVAVGTRSTDSSGAYGFANLPPDTYGVRVQAGTGPAGAAVPASQSPRTVVLAAHQQAGGVDFGYRVDGSVGDRVWFDADGDGEQDAGEPGLAGVALGLAEAGPDDQLGTADDVAAGPTTSAGDGAYLVHRLAPGRYRVSAAAPLGMEDTTAPTRDLQVAASDELTAVDFGFRHAGWIGDLVWVDRDADGLRDQAESGQGGVTVTLSGAGPDGALGTADDTASTAVTAADGGYRFSHLGAGAYRVAVDIGSAPEGTALSTDASIDVQLAAGQAFGAADFGLRWTAVVSGTAWQDLDADSLREAGEPGLATAVVRLQADGPDGTFGTVDDVDWGTRTTDGDGTYTFTNLAPDTYRVVMDPASANPRYGATRIPAELTVGPGQVVGATDLGVAVPEWRTVALAPGEVTTVAGNGLNARVDGAGGSASFTVTGGMVVVGAFGYVHENNYLRRIELATGQVSTFAGGGAPSPGWFCADAPTGAQSAFGPAASLATDGYYLYTLGRCQSSSNNFSLRRTSLATGATSTVLAGSSYTGALAVGPGGEVYVALGLSVLRVNVANGTTSTFASLSGSAASMTADATALWVIDNNTNHGVYKVPFATATPALVTSSYDVSGALATSAGDYLYLGAYDNGVRDASIRRMTKATGALTRVAGATATGYVDGTGTDAWFGTMSALASDGQRLWVADAGNRRIRVVNVGQALPAVQPPHVQQTVAVDSGAVTTVAGNGATAKVDGSGTSVSFNIPAGMVVVGGYGYVSEMYAIRRVDLATGEVTTLAGGGPPAGGSDCGDGPGGSQSAFFDNAAMGSDGYYIFSLARCRYSSNDLSLRRTSIATGATSTVLPQAGYVRTLAVGPNGTVYVALGANVLRVDTVNGTTSTFATLPSGSVRSMVADATALWVLNNAASRVLYQIPFATAVPAALTSLSAVSGNVIASAGDYLYMGARVPATGIEDASVVRVRKADGAVTSTAGGTVSGFVDGTGADVRFGKVAALAADGEMLWAVDVGNRRLRLVATSAVLMAGAASFGVDGYAGIDDDVNPAVGNYLRSDEEAKVATIGPELAIERTYNSLDSRVGPFGIGWSFALGMRAERLAAAAVAVLFPDGRREVHKLQPTGTYLPPPGYNSTLVANGIGGFDLRTKDATTYVFDAEGRVVDLYDENLHRLTFTYQGGHLSEVEDVVSGRALTLVWSGDKVSEVRTDAVAAHGGPLVWRYVYDGDRLTKVCDPRDNDPSTGSCVVYTWAANRITKVTRPRGNTEVELAYQGDGRVDWKRNGVGDLTDYAYPTTVRTEVIDGRGNTTAKEYDGAGRLVKETDAAGKATSYEYTDGYRTKVTDANANTSFMAYDARGNLTAVTDGEGRTSYNAYDAADNKVFASDGRSAGGNDATYATVSEYDARGNRTKQTSPATAEYPAGVSKRWEITNGTEAGFEGGVVPPGLVRVSYDERDKATTFSYDTAGNLRRVVDPAGLRTEYGYDELGRRLTETVYSDSFPAGLTTTTTWTRLSQPATVTSPRVSGSAGEADHQARTTTTYDANANAVEVKVEDLVGGNAARTTTYDVDGADRQWRVTDPEGGQMSRTFDAAGNVRRVTDAEGRVTRTDYDVRNLATAVVLENFVDDPVAPSAPRDVVLVTTTYDDARRKRTETDALGRVRRFGYDKADRLTSVVAEDYVSPSGTHRDVSLLTRAYDAAGQVVTETRGGTQTITAAYDPAGRVTSTTVDPGGLNRATTFAYDRSGNVVARTTSGGARTEQVRRAYDDAGRLVSETVENGAVDLTTTFGYDSAGRLRWRVEPRGNLAGADPAAYRTDFGVDEAGRTTSLSLPPVAVEEGGGASVARPTTATGYDTFGSPRRVTDPRGNTTVSSYDRLGRRVRSDYPAYSRPDGQVLSAFETFSYDEVGNLVSRTDRRGGRFDVDFDARNRPVREQAPEVAGQGRAVTRSEYDDAGNLLARTGPTGARSEWTYDKLNRRRTETAVVRQPTGPAAHYTASFDYDDRGNLTRAENQVGDATTQTWTLADELATVTDPRGEVSTNAYDLAGRRTSTTDPLGRATRSVYDLAGRLVATERVAPGGAVLSTDATGYDAAGNRTSTTDGRGFTTTFALDAAGRVVSVTQPVSAAHAITTTAGYDAAGAMTRLSDGRGSTTLTTYNAWGLAESTTEAATAAHPALSDRRWQSLYDAGGLPVEERQPGGVVITRSFDEAGRLRSESGSGGGAPAAERSFGYDLAGRRTEVSHPAGTIAFAYDDRGLLTGADSPSGDSAFAYDPAGRMTSRTDAAGTASFGWTSRSELASATDPLTGVTRSYTWDDAAGQLARVDYGTDQARRLYHYDDAGRLVEDALTRPDASVAEREAYGYDADDHMVSRVVELAGNPAAGASSYSYDWAGRLASWAKPDGTTVAYGFDDAGNRTSAGPAIWSYDERNRQLSGPDGAATWTPRGTLASVTGAGGATTYTFDALGRLADYDGQAGYAYDGLDRIATRNGAAFAYAGTEIDPVADGASLFARSPGGDLLALADDDGANAHLVGRNRHGDLTHLFDADGDLDATRAYDPFGDSLATTGQASAVGFQGDWTDPDSGKVWMGARWYDGADATFASRDSVSGGLDNPVGLNRYTYAFADPLSYFDPDGHWPRWVAGGTAYLANTSRAQKEFIPGTDIPKPPGFDQMTVQERKPYLAEWSKRHVKVEPRNSVGTLIKDVGKNSLKTAKTGLKLGVSTMAGAACGAPATLAGSVAFAVCAGAAWRLTDNLLNNRPLQQGVLDPRAVAVDAGAGAALFGASRLISLAARPVAQFLSAGAGQGAGQLISKVAATPAPQWISRAASSAEVVGGFLTKPLGQRVRPRSPLDEAGSLRTSGKGESAARATGGADKAVMPDETPIYRGVSTESPMHADALEGRAIGQDPLGHADPDFYNAGFSQDSRLHAWSTDPKVAESWAGAPGDGGVIMNTTIGEVRAQGRQILRSPDRFNECEIFILGLVEGCGVRRR